MFSSIVRVGARLSGRFAGQRKAVHGGTARQTPSEVVLTVPFCVFSLRPAITVYYERQAL